MTKRISFDERTERQHKNRMSHLLSRIRKNRNFSETDYDDLALYCNDIEGLARSGSAYMKRIVDAVKKTGKHEEIPLEWI